MHDEQVKEALITYEKLQAIEDDFEDVELEIRKSTLISVSHRRNPTNSSSPSAG